LLQPGPDEAGDGLPLDILIDDADLLPDGPLAVALEDLIRRGTTRHRLIVLAGTTDALVAAFRGPATQARRARTGILLGPANPHDGELLGVRLPHRGPAPGPAGRGWLVMRGVAAALQLADPATMPDPLPVGAALAPVAYPSTELELSRLGDRSRE
jgi:DNA segregation ATPase FtsK/SpoIIIE, S-DNA-T family